MTKSQKLQANQQGFFSFVGVILLVVVLGAGWLIVSRLSATDETIQTTSVNAVSGSLPFGLINPFQKDIDPNEFTALSYRVPNGWAKFGEGAGYKFYTPKDWLTTVATSSDQIKQQLVVQSPDFQESETGANAGARLTFKHTTDRWVDTITEDNADILVEQFSYGDSTAVQRFQIDQTNGIRLVDESTNQALAIWYANGSKYSVELSPAANENFADYVRIFDKVIASFNFF